MADKHETNNYYALIMAGGGGTRLWPLSRQEKPKQLLKLVGDRTLFQVAVDRLLGLFPPQNIYVVTSALQAEAFLTQSPEIPVENYVIEPAPRDTAAAIGLAAVAIAEKDPAAIMAVVTADHFIDHVDKFLQTLEAAKEAAEEGYLVTLGIHPTFASTGFGYIQQGDYLGTYKDMVVFRAESFNEKPDQKTAEKFLEGEDHSWNSGMFIWQVERVLKEIERQMPELHQALQAIKKAMHSDEYKEVLAGVWQGLGKISVDFGIMEGAGNVAVIPTRGLGWNDVGSWNALFDVLEADENGNIIISNEHIDLGSRGSLVFANGKTQRLIVTIGLEDLTVVDTGDVLLVCSKERAQDVREIVNLLKEQKKTKYL